MPTQKKLGPEGVGVLWEKVFSVMKSITGAVDVEKGTLQEQINKKVESDGDASNTKVDFQISSGRENISTGETIGRIFGKVSKWLADLKPHAFYDLIQNAATAATDRAVSAAVAKALQDQITALNTNRTLIGVGFNAQFSATGYKFIEVFMDVSGYTYTEIFPVQTLVAGNKAPLIHVRYSVNDYLTAFYAISTSGISGPTVTEKSGGINMINSIEIYGIK